MKKLYEDQDINDIIEAEEEAFFKGGVGSGIKGHTGTKVDMNMTNRNAPNPNSRSEAIARNNFKDKLKQIKENDSKIKDNNRKIYNHSDPKKIGT